MPQFTKETAASAARNATKSRVARKQREKIEREAEKVRANAFTALIPRDATFDARQMRIARQIDQLDEMIAGCKNPDLMLKFISAKARLHELIYPKPGSYRPGKRRPEERAPVSPVQPIYEPVIPEKPVI